MAGCGCGKKMASTTVSSSSAPLKSEPSSFVAPKQTPRVEYKPPVQTRPIEYCVVNQGKIISCFATKDEAKAERHNIGATSVITRFK